MNARANFPKSVYPGKVAIRHAIETARACGLDVGGFEVCPDGTIRILDARKLPAAPMDEFERLEAKGLL